jgi:predicted  nucleic acid-binding Zn-ribbon protein
MLADTEKKLVNSNRMKEDLQSKVAELQERIQKQAEQLKEKEARMQGLISKMGDSAIRSDSQDDNTARKFKDLLRQQN